MAKSKISDVIEPSIFLPYVIERTTEKSLLFGSGLISRDSRIESQISGGGRTINMPFWNTLSGDSEVLSDSNALTPDKIDASQDVAVLNMRGKAWSANDLAAAVAGDDPMRAIGDQVADFWAQDFQKVLNSLVNALFNTGGTLNSTHVNDIFIEDGDAATGANKFSDQAFLDTVYKLGDMQSQLSLMIVHSTIAKSMSEQDLITFVQPSTQSPQIPTYRGRPILVDDGAPFRAGTTSGYVYTSVIFAVGAIGYGEVAPANAVETDRVVLAGDDVLVHRRHFVLHPRGVKWVGNPAGAAPTNAELSTVGNWSKVWSNKNVRMVALRSNG